MGTKRELTLAQQAMVDDGCPAALVIPQEERAKVWAENPPKKVLGIFSDPKEEERKRLAEQFKTEEVLRRRPKPVKPAFDPRGMRWNSRLNKWTPDTQASSQDYEMAKAKYKITPYNAAGEEIKRGVTSIPADTEQVQLLAKMGASLHRCAAGIVEKVTVTDDDGAVIRQWIKGEPELPEPEKVVPQVVEKAPKKGKGKATTKVKTVKATNDKKPKSDKPKGPGVIATIVEIISQPKGASLEEAIAKMIKIFPDREVKGMTSTFRIQANKHSTSKQKDDKRGMVYFRK